MNLGANRLSWIAFLFATQGILGLVPHPALGQAVAPLPKVFEQNVRVQVVKMSMDDILVAINKQTQISILVDDEPILHQVDLALDGSLHDALDKVADTFDYTWRVSKAGVVLMSKRFKNIDERPQLNLPEMLEMTRNVIRALTLVDYDKDEASWHDLVKRTAQSFTAAQWQQIESGHKLLASELLPDQKLALEQATIANTFLASLKVWESFEPDLQNMERSRLEASIRPSSPRDPPGTPTHNYFYVYRAADGQIHSIQLSNFPGGEISPGATRP